MSHNRVTSVYCQYGSCSLGEQATFCCIGLFEVLLKCLYYFYAVYALYRVATVSRHQIDMDNLVGMGSKHHHSKGMVSHKVISHQQAAMELLLMVSHMVMVHLARSLVYMSILIAFLVYPEFVHFERISEICFEYFILVNCVFHTISIEVR